MLHIAMRHGVRHIRTLKDVAFYVANNCGGKLTYQNIAAAYSLGSLHTAKNYLSYLQDAYGVCRTPRRRSGICRTGNSYC